ncbi:hypothetical protein GF337_13015 [candidate division KSB1 bacterium]|nr:hypothetical protein [candidate division KSB1 bacterium]
MVSKKSCFCISFLSLVILLVVLSLSSYATETRVSSMGGVGFYIRDNSNVFYFPGVLSSYNNQVIAELRQKGNDDLYTVGAHLPFGTNAVAGVYLNRPLYLPTEAIADVAPHLELNRTITLAYGSKLANYDVGLMVSMAMDKWSEDDGENEEKESARYFNISAGISNQQYDLGVTLDLPSISWDYDEAERSWGGLGFGVNARYFMPKTDELTLVPLGIFYYGSATAESKSEFFDSETNYGMLDLALALGLNYQLNEKNLVVLALEAFGLSQETEDVKEGSETTEKYTTLPGIYLGLESQVKPWLVGRMGASQIYQTHTRKVKPADGESMEDSDYNTSFSVFFGIGINIGGFTLDASFNEGILFDGPHFISGISNNIANRISITYQF